MSEWIKTQTIQHGSCTIVIHRPVLTAEEREKREQQTCATLARLKRESIHTARRTS